MLRRHKFHRKFLNTFLLESGYFASRGKIVFFLIWVRVKLGLGLELWLGLELG